MFKIYDGRDKFYQWDIDRKIIVDDPEITQVHFCNRTDNCSLVCETYIEDGLTVADVPNILLQTDWLIRVYAYDGKYTKHERRFDVVSRTKPADYVYTETDIINYSHLLERMNTIDENIESTIREYIDEHPESVKGEKGDPGYTPQKGIDYFDGYTPIKGVDYWTAADKTEIVNDVLNTMPQAEEVEV